MTAHPKTIRKNFAGLKGERIRDMLQIKELVKKYPDFALKNISFCIPKGKITGFIGNNGAGKTTTLKCILGLTQKDAGSILLKGKSLEQEEAAYKNAIGVVFDEGYFYDFLSMKAMKGIVANAYSRWDERTFQQYMERFHLDASQKIETLSKGMKMKFALALALSHKAELLVLDEPTSGLDPKTRKLFCDIMLEEKEKGKTIFFSTHIISDLEKTADEIILINDGVILFQKEKAQLLKEYTTHEGQPTIEEIMLQVTKGAAV